MEDANQLRQRQRHLGPEDIYVKRAASIAPAKKPVGKRKEEFRFAIGKSSLGAVLVASSDFGAVSIIVSQDAETLAEKLQDRFPRNVLREDARRLKIMLAKAIAHIEKPAAPFDIPLDMRGTGFQRRVWKAAQKIPVGETSTYSDIAAAIGAPRAMRAVGSSCTNNHFFMAVPCHRVLHKGESVAAGFSRSSKRQRMLVTREVKMKP